MLKVKGVWVKLLGFAEGQGLLKRVGYLLTNNPAAHSRFPKEQPDRYCSNNATWLTTVNVAAIISVAKPILSRMDSWKEVLFMTFLR